MRDVLANDRCEGVVKKSYLREKVGRRSSCFVGVQDIIVIEVYEPLMQKTIAAEKHYRDEITADDREEWAWVAAVPARRGDETPFEIKGPVQRR